MSTAKLPRALDLPICDHTPAPYTGPSRDEVLALRQQYVSPGLVTYYKDPMMIVEGHMQYVFDETGKRYLDGFAGIVTISVGHCHPSVVAKVKDQVGRLQHTTTIYLHPAIGQFAQKLAEKMPEGLDRTYFTNSGSEANELAILSAREHTGNASCDRDPQRLSRRDVGRHVVDGTRHVEVQIEPRRIGQTHSRRLLLPLPAGTRVSVLQCEVCT